MKEEAACYINGLKINLENSDNALKNLESIDLIPVYFTNGEPNSPFVMLKKKVRLEEPRASTEFSSGVTTKKLQNKRSI